MDSNWNALTSTPPENTVLVVKDDVGNECKAFATYFPFDIVKLSGDERKPWGWRGTIVPAPNHWDGGWMLIAGPDLLTPELGQIVEWKIKY